MAKYSKGAGKKVEEALHEMKEGKLKIGKSNRKVTNPKQAIAIGLSEAREKGEKVPKKSSVKKAAKKTGGKKAAAKKASGKKAKAKKKTPKKAVKKQASKKSLKK